MQFEEQLEALGPPPAPRRPTQPAPNLAQDPVGRLAWGKRLVPEGPQTAGLANGYSEILRAEQPGAGRSAFLDEVTLGGCRLIFLNSSVRLGLARSRFSLVVEARQLRLACKSMPTSLLKPGSLRQVRSSACEVQRRLRKRLFRSSMMETVRPTVQKPTEQVRNEAERVRRPERIPLGCRSPG